MKKLAFALCLVILFGLLPQDMVLAGTEASSSSSEGTAPPPPTRQPAGASSSAGAGSSGEGASSGASGAADPEGSQPSDPNGMPPDEDAGGGEEGPSAEAQEALAALVAEQEVMALVYLSDEYTVVAEPSFDAPAVVVVPSGQQVRVQQVRVLAGTAWVRVTLEHQDALYEGYVERNYLACSDERFLAWEEEYDVNPPQIMARAARSSYPDISQFPESYQATLLALKNSHPNWTFVKMNTGLDWNTVVANEMADGRSLVPNSFDSYMKIGPFGTQGWSYASQTALTYYLDPRNWLNEQYIFQFEQLTYNASYHTEAAVQSFLNGSFMRGTVPGDSRTYARLFCEIGKNLGVSPFHLACRAYYEQGVNGSTMVSGTYGGYEGYYNYYNIDAAGKTTEEVLKSGLQKAKNMGWNTHTKSIQGGADIISANYIRKGQDTLYLQKYDVEPNYNGLYWHQYQQNVVAAATEGKKIRELYAAAGSLNSTFVFKIPVYNNMPASNCILPSTSYSISVTPPAGYGDAKIYLDGVEYGANLQGNAFSVNAGGPGATTAVMYKYDGNGVPVGMYVWTLMYNNGAYQVTAAPELENLLSYHGFSVRITGKAGIRFKTGISTGLRAQLTGGGAGGFKLREYGTLVMNNASRSADYPLVKGGERVSSGASYNSSMDAVYETVDGRYRYTSVLVGLPANQYRTEFAFRGYISLTKDGRDYMIYGPTVSRSIYSLAKQVIDSGYYPQGSDADVFLRKLLSDAG